MGKFILICSLLILNASTSFAQVEQDVVGIYADAGHSSWCAELAAETSYIDFHIYLFAYDQDIHSEHFSVVVFKLVIADPSLDIVSETYPEYVSLVQADWTSHVEVGFSDCMAANEWIFFADLYIVAFPPGIQLGCQAIEVVPSDITNSMHFHICGTYSDDDVDLVQNYYLNCDPCPGSIATEEKSWGAIKNLFNE